MELVKVGSIVGIASGLLIAAFCLPLALGKVAPNKYYGVRVESSFRSDADWYRINGAGGKIGVGLWLTYVLFCAAMLATSFESRTFGYVMVFSPAIAAIFWVVLTWFFAIRSIAVE